MCTSPVTKHNTKTESLRTYRGCRSTNTFTPNNAILLKEEKRRASDEK